MACSQRDMFLSSPEPQSPEKLDSSLPSNLTYTYLWIVLFDWDENVEFPFTLYQVAVFPQTELKPCWLTGDLDLASRMKKMSFSGIPGKTFSLFAKVEKCKLYYFFIFTKELYYFLFLQKSSVIFNL